MKNTLLSALLFLEVGSISAFAATSTVGSPTIGDSIFSTEGNGGIDTKHYDLNIKWDSKTGVIDALTSIDITATQKLSAFSLDFHALKVSSVKVDGKSVAFSREKDKLMIVLPRTFEKGSDFKVEIAYEGIPKEIEGSVTSGWHRLGDGVSALSEPNSAKNWFPSNNHPKDKATYAFHITVPKSFEAVANGMPGKVEQNGETKTYNFSTREPLASYLTVVEIGHYNMVFSKTKNAVPVYSYYYKGMSDKDKKLFDKQNEIMEFFSDKFGAYPFESAGIIAKSGKSILAYETQTRSTFGTPANETMLAHEIAHQWFGDLVSLSQWKESWLKEGFATYSSALWSEHEKGKVFMDQWVKNNYESMMGIQYLPKKGLGELLQAFEIKERILSTKEVEKLILLGTKEKTNSEELKQALAMVPEKGISSFKLDEVFAKVSFKMFKLTIKEYGQFMSICNGETPKADARSFEDFVGLLALAPRKVNSLEDIYGGGTYTRGALAMHSLRLKVGDEKFFSILQTYFKRYKNSHADSDDFEAIATEVSGQNLDSFFKAWLEEKLIPDMPEYGLFKKDYKQ